VSYLKSFIDEYQDFPKKGINFKDIIPIIKNPKIFKKLINDMSCWEPFQKCDAVLAIDARGFIFGTAIALEISKPLVLVRKTGKLPGTLIEENYDLEYGKDTLSVQKKSLEGLSNFVIVDDLLATGGTVKCVEKLLKVSNKKILGLAVVIELKELYGKKLFNFPVNAEVAL
tara:strand:+ start:285 stop:797 length:513 start_codon:yes stop_codon:yes gene_type:complete